MPVLTPSSMLHLWPNQLPELSAHHIQERDLKKRAKYLLRCKEAMWCRWTKEYVQSLRERHSKSGGEQTPHPSVGDVVIIQDESRNRDKVNCRMWRDDTQSQGASWERTDRANRAASLATGVIYLPCTQCKLKPRPRGFTLQAKTCRCCSRQSANLGNCTVRTIQWRLKEQRTFNLAHLIWSAHDLLETSFEREHIFLRKKYMGGGCQRLFVTYYDIKFPLLIMHVKPDNKKKTHILTR